MASKFKRDSRGRFISASTVIHLHSDSGFIGTMTLKKAELYMKQWGGIYTLTTT